MGRRKGLSQGRPTNKSRIGLISDSFGTQQHDSQNLSSTKSSFQKPQLLTENVQGVDKVAYGKGN